MREGGCRCGAVRYAVDGPLRDILVCHCDACRSAAGGPWAATAGRRSDLVVVASDALRWNAARCPSTVRAAAAAAGAARSCSGTRRAATTVSIGVDTLDDASGLEVAGQIWVRPARGRGSDAAERMFPRGLPDGIDVPWRDGPTEAADAS